jgi:hypothetical protein
VVDGIQLWDATVNAHVSDADARKGSIPDERYRHYMDIDFYPEFFSGTLSHDRSVLEAQYEPNTVLQVGVAPWAIGEEVEQLTSELADLDWTAAALTIADLCHYVGDLHVPLHCTLNFNGQNSGNDGIHSRWESTMLGMFLGEIGVSPGSVEYFPDAVEAAFDIIDNSYPGVAAIMSADDMALVISGGSFSNLYYQSLWQLSGDLATERVIGATEATASFVYTAWIDAGQPPVPGSTVDVTPIPEPVAVPKLIVGPNPFTDFLVIRWDGPGPFSVQVFNARGRVVDVLEGGEFSGQTRVWRPSQSRIPLSPGLYFVRVQAPGLEEIRRAIFLK